MLKVTCAHPANAVIFLDSDFEEGYCTRCGAYKATADDRWEMPALLKNLHVEPEDVGNE